MILTFSDSEKRLVATNAFVKLSLFVFVTCLCLGAAAQNLSAHDRAFWKDMVRDDFKLPDGESAIQLSRELDTYLSSPDPELRDDIAYTVLATWIDRGVLPPEELLSLAQRWRANLTVGIGEAGTDSAFRRSFSALLLAEVVQRDGRNSFLGAEEFRSTLDAALTYLNAERDLRGYDEAEGWIHTTAHTADLLLTCARHPQFSKSDQRRVLAGIADRLESAGQVYTHGEQDRLARAAVAIVEREDFDSAAFSQWTAQLQKSTRSAFATRPLQVAALATRENNLQLLRSLYVRLALRDRSERRDRALADVLAVLRTLIR